jgi:hypothetical protein
MKLFRAALLVAPLALSLAAPAFAHSGLALPGPSQVADAAPADHSSYAQQAQQKTQEWRGKLDDFNQKAEAKGTATGKATMDELNKAWTKVKVASASLQTTGAADWASAKMNFEAASQSLSDAWTKARDKMK